MRTPLLFSVSLLSGCLLGCGPEQHSAEFYAKPENAAEFAKALEICKKSGLSQKEKCASVWQAKMDMDKAADEALIKQITTDMKGTTSVPQSPRRLPVADPVAPQKAPPKAPQEVRATADADPPHQN